MTNTNSIKPLIQQGWLRALVFSIFFFILFVAGNLSVSFYVKAKLFGLPVSGNDPLFYYTILMSCGLSLFLVFVFRKWIDRKSFKSLGLNIGKYWSQGLAGFFLAVAILGIGTILLYFSGHLQWVDITYDNRSFLFSTGSLLLVAFYEEIVFRGYILDNLLNSINPGVAVLISAFVFMLFHIGSPSADFISFVTVFAVGILLGMQYLQSRNLWFCILFHFSWNFFQGPVMGYPVSGLSFHSLLEMETKGNTLMTGGQFGYEGSMLATALTIAAIAACYFINGKKKISLRSQPVPDRK